MMLVTYGPLSIDEARECEEDDDSADDESFTSIPVFNIIRHYRPYCGGLHCNRNQICIIVLFILCMIISLSLVVMKEMFQYLAKFLHYYSHL